LRIHRWGGLTGLGRWTKEESKVTFGGGRGEGIKASRQRNFA
jgi:hypothetical protein